MPPNIYAIRPQLAAAAQRVYDAWEQDDEGYSEEYAYGGICHDIADEMCAVLDEYDFPCVTFAQSIGEVHVMAIAQAPNGVYLIDISPSWYEMGGGYTWQKIPEVRFSPDTVTVERLYDDPAYFAEYLDE